MKEGGGISMKLWLFFLICKSSKPSSVSEASSSTEGLFGNAEIMIMARWALLTSTGLVYVSRLQKYDKSELKKNA